MSRWKCVAWSASVPGPSTVLKGPQAPARTASRNSRSGVPAVLGRDADLATAREDEAADVDRAAPRMFGNAAFAGAGAADIGRGMAELGQPIAGEVGLRGGNDARRHPVVERQRRAAEHLRLRRDLDARRKPLQGDRAKNAAFAFADRVVHRELGAALLQLRLAGDRILDGRGGLDGGGRASRRVRATSASPSSSAPRPAAPPAGRRRQPAGRGVGAGADAAGRSGARRGRRGFRPRVGCRPGVGHRKLRPAGIVGRRAAPARSRRRRSAGAVGGSGARLGGRVSARRGCGATRLRLGGVVGGRQPGASGGVGVARHSGARLGHGNVGAASAAAALAPPPRGCGAATGSPACALLRLARAGLRA